MPYTKHGYWYGEGEPTQPGPALVAKCGGPAVCTGCATDAGFKLRDGDQPLPTRNDRPDVQSLVIADIRQRREVGIQRYGTALQAHNGRDGLRDLYEELLDGAMYARQLLEERKAEDTQDALDAEKLARLFYGTYERLAPEHGFQGGEEETVPWDELPDDEKALTIAVAEVVLKRIQVTVYARLVEEQIADRMPEIERELRTQFAEELHGQARAHAGPLTGTKATWRRALTAAAQHIAPKPTPAELAQLLSSGEVVPIVCDLPEEA